MKLKETIVDIFLPAFLNAHLLVLVKKRTRCNGQHLNYDDKPRLSGVLKNLQMGLIFEYQICRKNTLRIKYGQK